MALVPYNRRAAFVVGSAAALARGAAIAYRNRRQLWRAGQAAGRVARRVGRAFPSASGRIAKRRMGRSRQPMAKRRKFTTLPDRASYNQLATTRRKYGKRVRTSVYQARLLKTLFTSVRQRYANFSAVSTANGRVFIAHQTGDAGDTFKFMPIHLLSLSTCNQGFTTDNTQQTPPALYTMQLATASGAINWSKINGIAADGTTARGSWEIVGPSDVTTPVIGRKGFLNWTRIRLCIWGKIKNPTNVRLTLLRFTEDEFCPEANVNYTTGIGTAVSNEAREMWVQRLKPLLVGQIGAQPRASNRGFKVIKRWDVTMNPIDAGAETSASDPRGHMRHIDLFHRWNRMVDFTTKLTGENDETYANLVSATNTSVPGSSYTGVPGVLSKGLYLMIESVSPNLEAFGASDTTKANLTASYDINVENSWGHIQRLS